MVPRSVPGTRAGSLESIPCGGRPYSTFMQRGGVWSLLNVPGFVDSSWEEALPLLRSGCRVGGGKDRVGMEVWGSVVREVRRRGRKLWLVCKTNKKFKRKKLKRKNGTLLQAVEAHTCVTVLMR